MPLDCLGGESELRSHLGIRPAGCGEQRNTLLRLRQRASVHVTGLIADSRSARGLAEHVELQTKLANANLDARDLDRQVNDAKERLREELPQAKAADDRERVKAISSQMLRDSELTLSANQRRRYALRVVQDGIIWRLFGYDRDSS